MAGVTPFDPDRYIGTITQVAPEAARANFPYAAASTEERGSIRGIVGEFIFIECEPYALFGRIVEVRLPDRERLAVEPQLGTQHQAHPIGDIRLLTSMHVGQRRLRRGLATHPRIGDRVFLAHPDLVAWMVGDDAGGIAPGDATMISLGVVATSNRASVRAAPERLFGRHCGILGTTGSGKSWTIAHLLEEVKRQGGKANPLRCKW